MPSRPAHRRITTIAVAATVLLGAVPLTACSGEPTPTPTPMVQTRGKVQVDVYGLATCPHCKDLRAWLAERDDVVVEYHEVSQDEGREALMSEAERLGFEAELVPVTVIGNQHWIGFDQEGIESAIVEAAG